MIGTILGIIAMLLVGLATLVVYSALVVSGRISHNQSDTNVRPGGRQSPPAGNDTSL